MLNKLNRPTGMKAFTIVWVGQFVSLLGTGMLRFAITLWAWELTGQATALALAAFFATVPMVLMSPVAGALVDRWNRKLVMMLSDMAASLAMVALFILNLSGNLEIWHIYIAVAVVGTFESFQFPAYSAAISTMVRKQHYARTSAMLSLADSASGILAPVFAVPVYVAIGLNGLFIIDIVTFLVALGSLLIVRIPQPIATQEGAEGKGSLLTESIYGFRYILRRRSLFGLQLVFLFGNLLVSFAFVLIAPMILARTGNNEAILAVVTSTMGLGGVVGGIMMSTWGGPKRRIHGVLGGWIIGSLLGVVVLGLGQFLPVWLAGALFVTFCTPLINASNQAIWQSKVAPDVQGRVFAVRRLIAQIVGPVALILAGPLADFVFEPAMQPGGALADTFGFLVGTGPGAGMGLMFVIAGSLTVFVAFAGYLIPTIRNVETIIPDHQQDDAAVPQSSMPDDTEPAAASAS
jgi:MFS transporter, DHA3 family, macrolide efflux protein